MPNPNVKRNPSTPKYGYNTTANRYVSLKTGKFVPRQTIKSISTRQVTKSRNAMLGLAEQLKAKTISVADYRVATMQQLKVLHVSQATAAKGGWAQMTQASYGQVGGRLRYQYNRFNNMIGQIESGKQKLNGQFMQRVQMYAKAGNATFAESERAAMDERGMKQERRMMHGSEHCDGCIEQAAKGWQPLGTLPPIGSQQCLTNCLCEFIFQND
ncbi:MAG: hypothetical protein V1899_03115 [Planctomycetota bacterium]